MKRLSTARLITSFFVAVAFFLYLFTFFYYICGMKKIAKFIIVAVLFAMPSVASAQTYVKMNALYATVGVINPSVEAVVSPHSSLVMDITFSPWRSWNGKHSQFGIFLGEYRYYFKEATSGWYLSANTGMLVFDIHRFQLFTDGKIISRQGQYGKGFGAAVGGTLASAGWWIYSSRWIRLGRGITATRPMAI